MDITNLSKEEQTALQEFTKLYESQQFEDALKKAEWALEKFPDNQAVWHNQVGALQFIVNNDFVTAFSHYAKAMEKGFDEDVCEDNMWEAAEEHFNSLRNTEDEGGSFVAIFNTGTGESIQADLLVRKYIEIFPSGKYVKEAEKLLQEFVEREE